MNIVLFSTAWGPKHGGINSFNYDFSISLSKYIGGNGKVICIVPYSSAEDELEAQSHNVCLISLRMDKATDFFHLDWISDIKSALTEKELLSDNIIWCGHDVFSGDIAIESRNLFGGLIALIHHMRYEYYESHKLRCDTMGDTKSQAQKDLFKRCPDAFLFAIGPLLKKSCEEIAGRKCIELVPGFAQFTDSNQSSNDRLKIITFGRMDPGADKIKQGQLAVAGFGLAMRRADENPGVPEIWRHNAQLTLVGISEGDLQSGALPKHNADLQANRSTNVIAVPFETDRNRLFDRLNEANLAVMPSLHEGFGLTGWESIAAEVPLILTKNSGLYQLIDQGLKGQGNEYVRSLDIKGGLENEDIHEADIIQISDAFLEIGSNLPVWREKARNLKRLLLQSNMGCTWERTAQTFMDAVHPENLGRRLDQMAPNVWAPNFRRPQPGHRLIREIEQRTAETALKAQRIVWVTCSPGMGEDDFCSVLMERMNLILRDTHIVDFSGCIDKNDFLHKFRSKHNCEFWEYFKYNSNEGSLFWLFKGVDTKSAVSVVEEMSEILIEYNLSSHILVLSNILNIHLSRDDLKVIKLKPLDEMDFKIYLRNNSQNPDRFIDPDKIEELRRYTDGIPAYIDSALKELEYTSIKNLISNKENNEYLKPQGVCFDDIRSTIASLKDSPSSDEKRAYQLLLALMAFPHGAQLDDIKRFYGPHGLHGRHADILRAKSLIDVKPALFLDSNKDETYVYYIHIPRPIRDVIKEDENIDFSAIDEKALNICLGDDWRHGKIRNSSFARKISSPTTDDIELENCSELIFRLFLSSKLRDDSQTLSEVVRLSVSFAGLLSDSYRFKNGIIFCQHAIKEFTTREGFRVEVTSLRIKLAEFLRMKGRDQEAIEECNLVDLSALSNQRKQSVMMTRVLCHHDLGNIDRSLIEAREIIRIERNSANALHAQFIIAKNIEEKARRVEAFKKILKKSRKGNHYILSNNILIEMYDEEDKSLKNDILQEVILQKNGDYYNFMRALSRYFPENDGNELLTKRNLMEAYHFLSGQRLMGLFDRYHKKLWDIFEAGSEYDNLIRLFRHSSFIWRLADKLEIENKYLRRLEKIYSLGFLTQQDFDKDSLSYFFLRRETMLILR